jgi:hypothetical protein
MKCSVAHLAAMKRWRAKHPDYMSRYYRTHPKQHKAHKAMVKRAYWRMRLDPIQWKKCLKRSRLYHRSWYRTHKAVSASGA